MNEKMEPFIIENYKPEYHEDVKRIFASVSGMEERIKAGIKMGWQSPTVIGYLTLCFIFGNLFSISYGFLALIFGFCVHAGTVFCVFKFYMK